MEDKMIKIDVWFESTNEKGFSRETLIVLECKEKDFDKYVPEDPVSLEDIEDCEWKQELIDMAYKMLKLNNEKINIKDWKIISIEYSEDNEMEEE